MPTIYKAEPLSKKVFTCKLIIKNIQVALKNIYSSTEEICYLKVIVFTLAFELKATLHLSRNRSSADVPTFRKLRSPLGFTPQTQQPSPFADHPLPVPGAGGARARISQLSGNKMPADRGSLADQVVCQRFSVRSSVAPPL